MLKNKDNKPVFIGAEVMYGLGKAKKPYVIYRLNPNTKQVGIKSTGLHGLKLTVDASLIDCAWQ